MKTNLYLVTGFLGSGKTTLMKKLLNHNTTYKNGVIVNEFGKENVDGIILYNKDFTITEISNGSIFCSCRSDLFIEALIKLGHSNLDNVFIETSGMSNPWSMPEVINIANKKTNNAYQYKGCVSVVDCSTFMKLSSVVNAINKQIAFADYILLNKSDLINNKEKKEILFTVNLLNNYAKIEYTSFCNTSTINTLLNLPNIKYKEKASFSTAAQSGVRKVLFNFNKTMDYKLFKKFITLLSDKTYRIKGFVSIDNKNYEINCVSSQISIKQINYEYSNYFIVLIADSKKPLKIIAEKIYKDIFNNEPNIKE